MKFVESGLPQLCITDVGPRRDKLVSNSRALYLSPVETPPTSNDVFCVCSIRGQTSSDFWLCLLKTQVVPWTVTTERRKKLQHKLQQQQYWWQRPEKEGKTQIISTYIYNYNKSVIVLVFVTAVVIVVFIVVVIVIIIISISITTTTNVL